MGCHFTQVQIREDLKVKKNLVFIFGRPFSKINNKQTYFPSKGGKSEKCLLSFTGKETFKTLVPLP